MAKKRKLKGVERHTISPRMKNYVLRKKPGSPIQAELMATDEPTYNRWSAALNAPGQTGAYELMNLAIEVAGEACNAGAPGLALRPMYVTDEKARMRNYAQFRKLTKELKVTGEGYCLDGGGSGDCKVWFLKTADASGGCAHGSGVPEAEAPEAALAPTEPEAQAKPKPKKPKDVQAELGPAESAFGPSAEPEPKPQAKKPKRPKRPTKAKSPITISKEKRAEVEAIQKANDSKGKRCKVLAREKGYTISECNQGFTFTAFDKKGEEIGRLDLSSTYNDDEYKVSWSGTSEKVRGEKVGLALYEAAAEASCKRGFTLTSDSTRSRYSENFWAKQERKGRATCANESEGMSRADAHDYVYENYLSEAEMEYIENSNYEDEAADAYFDDNSSALNEAKSEYISNNDLQWEAYESFFSANPESRDEAISEYIDNHEDELELSSGEEEGQYYATPWRETQVALNAKAEAARKAGDTKEFDRLKAEYKTLDEKLPKAPDNGQWPCHHYTLDADICQKQEIDLGKLPQGHVKRKGNKCPPGYRKHKAKSGMVSCRPVRRRKR